MPVISYILWGLALLALAVWVVLVFSWGSFWQVRRYDADRDSVPATSPWPSVAGIIPARNEAFTIRRTISALAQQDYPGEFRMIVVDDDSDDGTADAARRAGLDAGVSPRLDVVTAPPLPPGWTGKIWAMAAGVRAASCFRPQWFWFVDADVVFEPAALRRLVSRAAHQHLSLASLMVLLDVRTFPERLFIPPFLYFFLMLYPPRWTAKPKSRTAGAAGGCLLLRQDALERIGGFASIRSELIDDCALARAVKSAGGRIWMGLTRLSTSIRRYGSSSAIRDMIARTAFTQLHYSTVELMGTLTGLGFVFFCPVLLTCWHDPRIWTCGLAAWALMCVSVLPTLTYYRVSPWLAPLLPVAAWFYAYATALSAVRYWLGRGGEWKHRAQAPARRPVEKRYG